MRSMTYAMRSWRACHTEHDLRDAELDVRVMRSMTYAIRRA